MLHPKDPLLGSLNDADPTKLMLIEGADARSPIVSTTAYIQSTSPEAMMDAFQEKYVIIFKADLIIAATQSRVLGISNGDHTPTRQRGKHTNEQWIA